MVLDDDNATLRKYTWGLDLSDHQSRDREGADGVGPASLPVSGIHGAGGIGGLLAVEETATSGEPAYWFFYDANGNIGQVVKDDTGYPIAAHYEYDPYGNVIASSGSYADANPVRFSTKWFDEETGLGYWGYRYYSPRLGRWMSRDPIGLMQITVPLGAIGNIEVEMQAAGTGCNTSISGGTSVNVGLANSLIPALQVFGGPNVSVGIAISGSLSTLGPATCINAFTPITFASQAQVNQTPASITGSITGTLGAPSLSSSASIKLSADWATFWSAKIEATVSISSQGTSRVFNATLAALCGCGCIEITTTIDTSFGHSQTTAGTAAVAAAGAIATIPIWGLAAAGALGGIGVGGVIGAGVGGAAALAGAAGG